MKRNAKMLVGGPDDGVPQWVFFQATKLNRTPNGLFVETEEDIYSQLEEFVGKPATFWKADEDWSVTGILTNLRQWWRYDDLEPDLEVDFSIVTKKGQNNDS